MLDLNLSFLQKELSSLKGRAKIAFLEALPQVKESQSLFQGPSWETWSEAEQLALLSVAAIGQAVFVFQGFLEADPAAQKRFLDQLREIDLFYAPMGGIVGYQAEVLQKLYPTPSAARKEEKWLQPEGIDLRHNGVVRNRLVRWGLEQLDKMAELYPVGGAADRLGLTDKESNLSLPAALLPFLGRSLLEGLIRDLQAREYLFFKMTGKQVTVPVGMMTSEEKKNQTHVQAVLEERHWFGRGKEAFFLFIQPLVPAFSETGDWALTQPLELYCKPGGHGVIWKVAEESGFFSALDALGKTACLVRQINNPIGGVDAGLLALFGAGISQNKAMGWISCQRVAGASEGMNVLVEANVGEQFCYRLTNIEYTEWARPENQANHPEYATYPANTNLLFVNVQAIRNAAKALPFPGLLVNCKQEIPFLDPTCGVKRVKGGRLESVMQNVADQFTLSSPDPLPLEECMRRLSTFLLYNERRKTLSPTKTASAVSCGTPERAYADLVASLAEALSQEGGVQLPDEVSWKSGQCFSVPVHLLFHPAVGPLHQVIGQKIRGGSLEEGAFLELEIAEVALFQLHLTGSLRIIAASPLGSFQEGRLVLDGRESRCYLKGVTVSNQGVDTATFPVYWKNQVIHREALEIFLGEGAEFWAEGITFTGRHHFDVPPHHRLTIQQLPSGELLSSLEPLTHSSWRWVYAFSSDDAIQLTMKI